MNLLIHAVTRATAIALLTLCLVVPGPAYASNLSFLKHSPMANLDKEDMRLLKGAASSLLETGTAGVQGRWANPQSGASGQITVLRVFSSSEGYPCKTLRFENNAGGWQGNYSAPVCEVKPGDWKIHAEAKPAPDNQPALQ